MIVLQESQCMCLTIKLRQKEICSMEMSVMLDVQDF